MQEVAAVLGVSVSYMSEVESNRKKPFDKKKLTKLAGFLEFSEEDKAMMYDLASIENKDVPYDIEDTFMYEEVGDLARFALRQSKAGFITEADWKTLIRQAEERKARLQTDQDGGADDK